MITIEYNTVKNETKHRQFISWEHFEKFILDEGDMRTTLFPNKSKDRINFELVLYKNHETYYINKLDEDDLIHYSNGRLTYNKKHISDHLDSFIEKLNEKMKERIEKLNFA